MIRFEEYEYRRPDYEKIQARMSGMLEQMKASRSAGEALRHAVEIDRLRDGYMTMRTLCSIRFAEDTNDPFYREENDYFDKYGPLFNSLNARFYQALLDSRWRQAFADFYGEQFLNKADAKRRASDERVIPLRQEERRLVSLNSRLTSGAMIAFDGKTLTLSQLSGYLSHPSREMRQRAAQAYYGYFASVADQTDSYYDQMVHIRHKIARQMGFENYIGLAYLGMGRTDYDAEKAAEFRRHVRQYVVPVTTRRIERQKKRLGVSHLPYYDETVSFSSGNPRPRGTAEEILQAAGRMYEKLSPETGEFFRFMRERGLIDVLSRPGKDGGAFSSYISGYGAPFLYANFNGTLSDVNVLTHEAGHAFQKYMARGLTPSERCQATVEASEVHSMSMELFTLPYMEGFFGPEADKYRFAQVEKTLHTVAYACVVDEFQHLVYANPDAAPAERHAMWRETERKYLPHRSYDGCPFLEAGGWWHRQGHIFSSPFYYIDYALAQVCALGFMVQMEKDYPAAWQNYLKLCRLGGTRSFLGLMQQAGIGSPFEEETVRTVAAYAEKYLEPFDERGW